MTSVMWRITPDTGPVSVYFTVEAVWQERDGGSLTGVTMRSGPTVRQMAVCTPPTPTPESPPVLPLIEPQPVYFYPTLPPAIVQGEHFFSVLESHHVVTIITRPGGHVALDTECAVQDNIGRYSNGAGVTFRGCDLTINTGPAEVVAIWPEDGITVLFQHWIEVHSPY